VPDAVEIKPLKYRDLKRTHPEYDHAYWQELRALYEGGKALLKNPEVFLRLFPRHEYETDKAFQERCRRAYYVNHLGTIIDFMVAGLGQDPARIAPPDAEAGAEVELEPFWEAFQKDCSAPGGKKQPFDRLLREQARSGLLLQKIWTLVDFPRAPDGFVPQSKADETEAGLDRGYAVAVPPENVIDWEVGPDGGLLWAMQRECVRPRSDLAGGRDLRKVTFTLWTREGWGRYVIEYTPKEVAEAPGFSGQVLKEPEDDAIIPVVVGKHSCGRVPLVLTELPSGLWAGNKLYSMAVEYLNKSCGLSWAECKVLFASLYEFLGQELPGVDTPISTAQQDPSRAKRNARGPGIVQVRGKDDRAEFISPPTEGYAHTAESLKTLREDMYRVTYQMALAEDNTGAVIKRSEGSKEKDHAATGVVLEAVGEHMRDHGTEVVETCEAGRGEEVGGHVVMGMASFDVLDVGQAIEKAVMIETMSIPSATYQVARKLDLVRADRGEMATPEFMEQVEKDLKGAITQDQFTMATMAEESTLAATAAVADHTAANPAPPAASGKAKKAGGKR
jgi:hypothetical protein